MTITPAEYLIVVAQRDAYQAQLTAILAHLHSLLPMPSFLVTQSGIEEIDIYGVGAAMLQLRAALDRAAKAATERAKASV